MSPDGEHYVCRRYQEFHDLEAHLRPLHPALPEMPQKGFLRKVLDAGFLDERQAGLDDLLQAIVRAWPGLDEPTLRAFLGVDAPGDGDIHAVGSHVLVADDAATAGVSDDAAIEHARQQLQHASTTSILAQRPPAYSWPRPVGEAHGSGEEDVALVDVRRCSSALDWPPSWRNWRRSSFAWNEAKRSESGADGGFTEFARIIARDVPRVLAGDPTVDEVRLQMADVLRGYAHKDPELGYTQGMCFAAAVVCLENQGSDAAHAFEALMGVLRGLWSSDFPMIQEGIPVLEQLLLERDPELSEHLELMSLDLAMVIPGAWLSVFAKWLPLATLREVVPFVAKEGLAGFLVVTLMILLFHRENLMSCKGLDQALPHISGLPSMPPPDGLMEMCAIALPGIRARLGRSLGDRPRCKSCPTF